MKPKFTTVASDPTRCVESCHVSLNAKEALGFANPPMPSGLQFPEGEYVGVMCVISSPNWSSIVIFRTPMDPVAAIFET